MRAIIKLIFLCLGVIVFSSLQAEAKVLEIGEWLTPQTHSDEGVTGSFIDVKADLYVSTAGADNWSGKLAEPNALGTDGPFATMARARDAVRELKAVHSKDIPVRNLHFSGLTFKHGERYTLTQDDAGLQHDWDMFDKDNALVRLRGTENCSIKKCHFLHSGSGAIRVDLHGMGNQISNSPALEMGITPFDMSKVGVRQRKDTSLIELLDSTLYEVPEIYWQADLDQGSIQALFYSALPYKGKETRVFAYIGIPKTDKPVPAMVLVHGGGGKAFHEWVKIWNDRGYAAIAMSLEGHMPDSAGNGKYSHAYSGPTRIGRFDDVELPLKEQWMYHAVSDIMLGHTLLASFPEVDASRIGITGISWGGILSSLVSGIDSRLTCVMPVYGAGYLYESKGHFGNHGDKTPEFIEKKKFWDPARQFASGKVPTLWVNGDSDGHFSVNITSKSYEITSDHACMTIHPGMRHGHRAGWNPEEIPELYAFADHMLKSKGLGLGYISQQPTGSNSVLAYESEAEMSRATIYYLTEPLTYRQVEGEKHARPGMWLTKTAKVNPDKKTVEITLPEECMTYYVNLEDERGFIISSVLVELANH